MAEAESEEEPQIPVKLVKHAEDDCFGEKYEEIEQCGNCWVKTSCHMRYKNRKPEEIRK